MFLGECENSARDEGGGEQCEGGVEELGRYTGERRGAAYGVAW